MPYFDTADGTRLFYEDWGQGDPIVLIHGWPASRNMFEYQYQALVDAGYRCIGYDRRGFGKSDRPWDGYDYNTFSDDLHALLEKLQLQGVTLVGFSMGGGEVARYLSRHGDARVRKAVFIAAVTPYLLLGDTNMDGVDKEVFDDMYEQFETDRPAALAGFSKQFFNVSLLNHPVSSEMLHAMATECMQASSRATLQCIRAFSETDFREDLATINVPTLIIHGSDDKIVPVGTGGRHTARLLPEAEYIEYEGAPHGLFYTERERLNQDLISFVQKEARVVAQAE